MGRGIFEGSPRTERIQLETRSSDPSSPSNGEAWLRTDRTGTDKVGEFRFKHSGLLRVVDVVTPGTTESGVEDVLRVQTPNGVGVIPTLPRADSAVPEFSLQHNGQILGIGVSDLPDSIVTLYEFEGDSDPTLAVDTAGSLDADISASGAVYSTDAKVGSYAMDHDGTDGYVESQDTVDLVADGSDEAASVAGWVKADSSNDGYAFGWGRGFNNHLVIWETSGGDWEAFLQVGNNKTMTAGVPASTSSYQHVAATVTQSTLKLWVDGVEEESVPHSYDITAIGDAYLATGGRPNTSASGTVLVDDFVAANSALGQDDIDYLIDRANS